MADFCSLCGYGDIDIQDLYNRLIRPTLKDDIKLLTSDQHIIRVNVSGVCEHCGLVSFGINNKYEAIGHYWSNEPHQFGYVDPETFELIIDEDDPMYVDVRLRMKKEIEIMEKYFKVYNENKEWIEIQRDIRDNPLTYQDKEFMKDILELGEDLGIKKSNTFTSGKEIGEFDEVFFGLVKTSEDSANLITLSFDEINEVYVIDHSVPISASGLPTLKIK